jgi:CheY-like chemotaxis protein
VHLLVAEDNALLQQMYLAGLSRLGRDGGPAVEIEAVGDGAAALARLRQAPPVALLVADLYMPVMDGFTLLEKLRDDPAFAGLPILAISAGGDDARQRAEELGVDRYLSKPVRMPALLEAARALLSV